jgi:Pectate lyase superfamily protein
MLTVPFDHAIQLADNIAYIIAGDRLLYGKTERVEDGIFNPGEVIFFPPEQDMWVRSFGNTILHEKDPGEFNGEIDTDFGFNAKEWGAQGDSKNDDLVALQSVIDACWENGGGLIKVPAGTYLVGGELTQRSGVTLVGEGWDATILKLADNTNTVLATTENYGVVSTHGVSLRQLRVDGNKAKNISGGGLLFDGQSIVFEDVLVLNTSGNGIEQIMTTEPDKKVSGLDSLYQRVRAIGCEGVGIYSSGHDNSLMDCQAIQCTEKGIQMARNGLMVNCHTWSYASDATVNQIGMHLGTDVMCVNCVAEGASVAQVQFAGTNTRWQGGDVFNGSGKPNVPLMEFLEGSTTTVIEGAYLHNYGTGGALVFTGNATGSVIKAHIYDPESKPAGIGTPHETVIFDISLGGSTSRGTISGHHVRQRRTFQKFIPGDIPNNTQYVDSATGRVKWRDNTGKTSYMVPQLDRLRSQDVWRPTGTKAENYDRLRPTKNLAAVLTSGTLYVTGGTILAADQAIAEAHFYSATTAAVEPTHQWAVLMDASRKVLAISADKTTEAWGANSKKIFNFAASYTPVGEDQAVYVGILVTATTVPTLRGIEAENSFPGNSTPALGGTSNTGLTVPSELPVGSTATALTAKSFIPYITLN